MGCYLQSELTSSESIAVHIRRGDYVTNPRANAKHGVLSPDYYQKAFQIIASKHKVDAIYLFSDDPDWLHTNRILDTSLRQIIVKDSVPPHEALWLMASAKHLVMANSSLSWWSGKLSIGGGLIFAPQQWFHNSRTNLEDLLLPSWITI